MSTQPHVTQAFVQYATGPFTAIAGKFNTLAGAEVIAPTGNTNISRSIAFLNAVPFTHTGVRFSFTPTDTVTLYAGLNNGWDQQKDQNTSKTLELGLAWNPTDMIGLTAQGYKGKEVAVNNIVDGTPRNTDRSLFDTVLTIKPTKELSLVLNYDYGKQEKDSVTATGFGDAKWVALVGYVNYQFTEQWRVSVRGESFDDKNGYRLGLADGNHNIAKTTKAYTLTVGYAPVASFELRGEVRKDKTDKKAFVKTEDTSGTPTGFVDGQTFLALEALYKF